MRPEPDRLRGCTVVVTGANGFLGTRVGAALTALGARVAALVRDPSRVRLPFAAEVIAWDPHEPKGWSRMFDGAYAVCHFSGQSIGAKRWTAEVKRGILASRVEGTRGVVEAMRATANPPRILVSSSGIGYYGDAGEREVDETSPAGSDFLARVCAAWESEALRAEECGARVAVFRTGLVLARDGGALPRLALPFRLFVGGPLGPGRQWFPWVHVDDVVGAWLEALVDERYRGPINLVAPGAVRNAEFSAALGRALRRPSLFRVPGFVLRAAVGEFAGELLGGQRAAPEALTGLDYAFRHASLDEALTSIYP
jgi:uncharacterized protein (TIGR01777 family)